MRGKQVVVFFFSEAHVSVSFYAQWLTWVASVELPDEARYLITSKACLPIILDWHLQTCFVWYLMGLSR